eukprot:3070331-Prorocentrum_lima.AAC.1
MTELEQQRAAKESAVLAKLERMNMHIERLQLVEQQLIQTVQDTEDRVVFDQGRYLALVAYPEDNE